MNQLLDRWLAVLNVEPSTRIGYVRKIDRHVRPMLGRMRVGRIDAELLETFYARLRKCRDHCDGRRFVQHRTSNEHESTTVADRTPARVWRTRRCARSTGY
jgi:integrase